MILLTARLLKLEVAAGLEPAKIGFADRRLDHFGIATKLFEKSSKLIPKSIPKTVPKMPSQRRFAPVLCPRNLLKPRARRNFAKFCRLTPYHWATTAPLSCSKIASPRALGSATASLDCRTVTMTHRAAQNKNPTNQILWRWVATFRPNPFVKPSAHSSQNTPADKRHMRNTNSGDGCSWSYFIPSRERSENANFVFASSAIHMAHRRLRTCRRTRLGCRPINDRL